MVHLCIFIYIYPNIYIFFVMFPIWTVSFQDHHHHDHGKRGAKMLFTAVSYHDGMM